MEEKKGMTPEAAFKMIAENELFAEFCCRANELKRAENR